MIVSTPHIDGNKRTSLSVPFFLELNGITILDSEEKLYEAAMAVASEKMKKEEFADILRELKD